LSIYVKDLLREETFKVWEFNQRSTGREWNYGSIGFFYDSPYTLLISAARGGYTGTIAVDDLMFKESQFCACQPESAKGPDTLPLPSVIGTTTPSQIIPSPYNCDFENDFCNWYHDSSKPLNWTRLQGKTADYLTGPSFDHTLGTADGWYIYLETSFPAKPSDSARIYSDKINGNSVNCLKFWYHMYGANIGSLNVIAQNTTDESLIWEKSSTQGNVWLEGNVNLDFADDYNLVFEAIRGDGDLGDIALDDISFASGYCPTNEYFKCDFESDLCEFINDASANFNWTREQGRIDYDTGPSVDHTTSSSRGHYMLIKPKLGGKAGTFARLMSKDFSFSTFGLCVKWYYHMYGADVDKLSVYVNSGNRSGLLWKFGGDIGNEWNYAQFSVPELSLSTKGFDLVFEGQGATRFTFANIAIDDVSLELGQCPSFGSCTFEGNDYCNWKNVLDARDDFDWEFNSHKTATPNTGPSTDHTLQSALGTYLFIDAFKARAGQKALLESPLFQATPSYGLCMDFWYTMYGQNMGSLNVYVNVSNTTSLLWTQSGNKGEEWKNGRIPVTSAKEFRLLFEGIRGKTTLSDIAIDDIDFNEKSCALYPLDSSPSTVTTTTTITTTVTKSLRPSSAYDCDFEDNLCNWSPSQGSTFNWTRAQGKDGSQIKGPLDADHTVGSPEGWYIFAKSEGKLVSDYAQIESPLIISAVSETFKCIEFYYYVSTNSKFNLNVYLNVDDFISPPVWSRSSSASQDGFWRLGRFANNLNKNYKVAIELTFVNSLSRDDTYAIDDIYFNSGQCADSSDINSLCTFTNGNTCGYTFANLELFEWKVNSPDTRRDDLDKNEDELVRAAFEIPFFDHTTNGRGSGFVYVQKPVFKSGATINMTSMIYEPLEDNSKYLSRCLEFYYQLRGTEDSMGLNVIVNSDGPSKMIWSRRYDHGETWWKGETDVNEVTNHSIQFQAISGTKSNLEGLVALDDISLRNGKCSR
jgi:hypothetical protein